jgi:hypothetical protein
MIMRRRLVVAGAAGTSAVLGGAYFHRWSSATTAVYARAEQETWRHTRLRSEERSHPWRELVRYATLAPSSHNTQCWKFCFDGQSVFIHPDFERRCPVVDPDDHHLFVSLGCAAENLLQASRTLGWTGEPLPAGGADESLAITLQRCPAVQSQMFEAIPRRQTTRGEYDGRALSAGDLRLLEAAGTGKGVNVQMLTQRPALESVLDFVIEANTAQMRDPAWVAELKQWVRYNGAHAARTGDGLFGASSGNPSLPGWLGSRMFDLFFSEQAENDKYARHVRSSAGVAVFVSSRDDKRHWVEAGRAFQRFALQATVLGVRTAHLNQPVEVAVLRPQFERSLGIAGGRVDLVVRFGRGPEMPRSLRRPLQDVLPSASAGV